jgi:transposase
VRAIKAVVDRLCKGTLRGEEAWLALVLAGNLPPVSTLRRLEVFAGAGRRRRWSDEDKARVVAEIVASGGSVCSIARRHGLSPRQLFGSRRQLRKASNDHSEAEEVQFVPACQSAFKLWTQNDNPHHASASGDARQRSWGTGDDDARKPK